MTFTIALMMILMYGLSVNTRNTAVHLIADDLAQFIYDAYNSGRDIVCQCDYGQSRSAGCAAAIAEHFYKSGIEIFADFSRCPNKLIYHKVIDALNDFSHNNKIPDQRRV